MQQEIQTAHGDPTAEPAPLPHPAEGSAASSLWGLRGLPDAASAAAFALPAALLTYLGLESGGFSSLVYSQLGIAAWWIVLLGAIAGSFAIPGRNRWSLIGLLLLGAFAAWTMAGVSWSPSSERSMIEVARVVSYLGVFALALFSGGRDTLRPALAGVGVGCAVIAVIALLSRFEPAWFPANELADVLPATESRLAYPLNYWNGLAGMIAVGMPLIIWMATSARSIAVRGLAAAIVPLMILTSYYTLSRGGAVATAIGILATLALSGRRLASIPPLGAMALAGGALVWAADRRPSLQSGIAGDVAASQGHAMLWITVAVGFVTALTVMGIATAARRGRIPAAPRVPRRFAGAALALVAVVALGGFLAADGPSRVADGWEQFKEPSNPGAQADRLSSASGNGRWQYWSAAIDAFESEPVRGIGPGTFVFFWSQNRDIPGFIRDAHSLFAETLGELGIIGLLALSGFVLLVLILGSRLALTSDGRRRQALAAATGSALAFTVAAGIDWLWELAVVPVAFLFVAAAILRATDPVEAPGEALSVPARRSVRRLALTTIAAATVAGIAITLIAIPMYGARDVADSQAAFRAGDYEEALQRAEDAADLQPYAASPLLQEAFAWQALGEDAKAAAAARAATQAESTNWETWYVLSRVQVARGKEGAALVALRKARSLDPLSPILGPTPRATSPAAAEPTPPVAG